MLQPRWSPRACSFPLAAEAVRRWPDSAATSPSIVVTPLRSDSSASTMSIVRLRFPFEQARADACASFSVDAPRSTADLVGRQTIDCRARRRRTRSAYGQLGRDRPAQVARQAPGFAAVRSRSWRPWSRSGAVARASAAPARIRRSVSPSTRRGSWRRRSPGVPDACSLARSWLATRASGRRPADSRLRWTYWSCSIGLAIRPAHLRSRPPRPLCPAALARSWRSSTRRRTKSITGIAPLHQSRPAEQDPIESIRRDPWLRAAPGRAVARPVGHEALLPTIRPDDGRQARAQTLVRDLQRSPAWPPRRPHPRPVQRTMSSTWRAQQPQLAFGHGRAQRGDDVSIAVLMGHHRVHIALDDHDLASWIIGRRARSNANRFSCLWNRSVSRELRYLGWTPSSNERPPKAIVCPCPSRIGKEPIAKEVEGSAIVGHADNAGGLQLLLREAVALQVAEQAIATTARSRGRRSPSCPGSDRASPGSPARGRPRCHRVVPRNSAGYVRGSSTAAGGTRHPPAHAWSGAG